MCTCIFWVSKMSSAVIPTLQVTSVDTTMVEQAVMMSYKYGKQATFCMYGTSTFPARPNAKPIFWLLLPKQPLKMNQESWDSSQINYEIYTLHVFCWCCLKEQPKHCKQKTIASGRICTQAFGVDKLQEVVCKLLKLHRVTACSSCWKKNVTKKTYKIFD